MLLLGCPCLCVRHVLGLGLGLALIPVLVVLCIGITNLGENRDDLLAVAGMLVSSDTGLLLPRLSLDDNVIVHCFTATPTATPVISSSSESRHFRFRFRVGIEPVFVIDRIVILILLGLLVLVDVLSILSALCGATLSEEGIQLVPTTGTVKLNRNSEAIFI